MVRGTGQQCAQRDPPCITMRLYSSVAGGLGNAQRRLIDDQWSARYSCCLLRIVRGRYVTVTTRKLQQSYLSYISLGFTRFD
jgi:hypothetical protein